MIKKCKKFQVAFIRVASEAGKAAVILIFFFVSALLSYWLIANMMYLIGNHTLLLSGKKIWGWFVSGNKYEPTTADIPAITVAVASIMLSMVTLLLSHFNRVQDRVMNFPSNYLDEVKIGFDPRANLELTGKYFDAVSSKNLIEFRYKNGFSTYYKVDPYRLYVCLHKGNRKELKEWEELQIYNFQFTNIGDDDPVSYEMLIEGSESRLLKEYCDKPDKNENIKLQIILDSKWKNNLMPLWMRSFGNMYIREDFCLSFQKEKGEAGSSFDRYKILFSEYKTAPLASWLLKRKCYKSEKKFRKKQDRESRNTRKLLERKK